VTWTLYFVPGACSLASHIALEQAGADYRAKRVDFRVGGQRSPEYLAINPKGRVPALVTERGVITETPAILTFVAQSFPASSLALPADSFDVAQIQAIVSYFCSTAHPARSHRVRGARWADDPAAIAEMARKAPQVVGDCFDLIEAKMLVGPWVMGDAYSICDPYLFTLSGWLAGDGMEIARWPKVAAHHARMLEDPAARRVLDAESPAAA